jgi:hypothetical protein
MAQRYAVLQEPLYAIAQSGQSLVGDAVSPLLRRLYVAADSPPFRL